MSKNVVITLVAVILVFVSYYYTKKNQTAMEPKDTMMVQEEKVKTNDASYIPFTPTVLADAASNRRVLYFYANWCPTCIPAGADFEKNVSMLPIDVTVIRVNYNDEGTDKDEKALATKYGITYQHTFVQIDTEGNIVTKWNGGATKELLAKIK